MFYSFRSRKEYLNKYQKNCFGLIIIEVVILEAQHFWSKSRLYRDLDVLFWDICQEKPLGRHAVSCLQ